MGELTAGIAHEFRNGLATIHGYSRLLVPDALPAQYRPYLEGIRQETEALGQIVTNFLNFARPETMSLTAVSLEPLARRATEELLRELPAGTTIEVTGAFGDIHGDEVLLRQVFANLVRNAAEACEAAGIVPVITIEGSIDPSAQHLPRGGGGQRAGHTGIGARPRVSAVLHHAVARDRPGAGDCAEGRGDPQRAGRGGRISERRRQDRYDVSARLQI